MPNVTFFMRWRTGIACGTLAVIIAAANSHARPARVAAEELPLLGNPLGGSPFFRTCPDNHVLTGFRYRSDLTLDAIVSIKCRPVRSDGTLGAEILAGSFAGGNGGTLANKSCSADQVIVGQKISIAGSLLNLTFFCVRWSATSKAWFGSGDAIGLVKAALSPEGRKCSSSTQPAIGIRGRHGMVIDAIGLVCNVP